MWRCWSWNEHMVAFIGAYDVSFRLNFAEPWRVMASGRHAQLALAN